MPKVPTKRTAREAFVIAAKATSVLAPVVKPDPVSAPVIAGKTMSVLAPASALKSAPVPAPVHLSRLVPAIPVPAALVPAAPASSQPSSLQAAEQRARLIAQIDLMHLARHFQFADCKGEGCLCTSHTARGAAVDLIQATHAKSCNAEGCKESDCRNLKTLWAHFEECALPCSQPLCMASGHKFRDCSVCKAPDYVPIRLASKLAVRNELCPEMATWVTDGIRNVMGSDGIVIDKHDTSGVVTITVDGTKTASIDIAARLVTVFLPDGRAWSLLSEAVLASALMSRPDVFVRFPVKQAHVVMGVVTLMRNQAPSAMDSPDASGVYDRLFYGKWKQEDTRIEQLRKTAHRATVTDSVGAPVTPDGIALIMKHTTAAVRHALSAPAASGAYAVVRFSVSIVGGFGLGAGSGPSEFMIDSDQL